MGLKENLCVSDMESNNGKSLTRHKSGQTTSHRHTPQQMSLNRIDPERNDQNSWPIPEEETYPTRLP